MLISNCCRSFVLSKAAKTFFWLVVCVFIIVVVVILFGAIEKIEKAPESNEKLEVCPRPNPSIHYKFKKPESINKMKTKIQKFLSNYRTWKVSQTTCSFNSTERKEGFTCKIDLDAFGPCTEKDDFGYPRATPCIFIKLNKVSQWTPKPYNLGDLNETDLKSDYIDFVENEVLEKGDKILNMIWADCRGKTAFDSSLLGDIDYYPWRGFPSYFFPYKNETRYMEPLIAIHLKNIRVGILIDLVCSFYAQNFNEIISFSVLVDDTNNF